MKYNEGTFRDFFHKWVAIEMTEEIRQRMIGYQGIRTANWVFCYGYVDDHLGFCFEVLACMREHATDHLFTNKEPNNDLRVTLTAEEVQGLEIVFFEPKKTKWHIKYQEKLAVIQEHEEHSKIKYTRELTDLDPLRDPYQIDCIMVYLIDSHEHGEIVWVNLEEDHPPYMMGEIVSEPEYNFGLPIGSLVHVQFIKLEDGRIKAFCDSEQEKKLTKEDLEDGSLLEKRIHELTMNRNELNGLKVLVILRESTVWVPCTTILSEKDQQAVMDMINKEEMEIDRKNFSFQDQVRLKPDILTNGDASFLPVFSSKEAAGEYGTQFSMIPMDFLDALNLSKGDDLSGIVVNAFSEPYEVPFVLYELIENMGSIFEK